MTLESTQLRRAPSITRPVAYEFAFAPYGWAIFTINDQTGEFAVQSDWGVYGYRWHVGALGGRTLTQFIAQADRHYLIDKLQLGTRSKELEEEIDDAATRRGIFAEIIKQRRWGAIDKERARQLWEYTNDWANTGYSPYAIESRLDDFLEHPPQFIKYKAAPWFLTIRDKLLPFFCEWLRANVLTKDLGP